MRLSKLQFAAKSQRYLKKLIKKHDVVIKGLEEAALPNVKLLKRAKQPRDKHHKKGNKRCLRKGETNLVLLGKEICAIDDSMNDEMAKIRIEVTKTLDGVKARLKHWTAWKQN